MATVARALFSGSGSVILQLLFLAIGGWFAEYLASAVGKGQLASLIKLACLFIGFCLVIKTISDAMTAFGRAIGF